MNLNVCFTPVKPPFMPAMRGIINNETLHEPKCRAGVSPASVANGDVSVYRGAAVLGRSNLGTLQRVGHFAGYIILPRFCARGRAHSAKHLQGDRRSAYSLARARSPDRLEACPTLGPHRFMVPVHDHKTNEASHEP